MKILTLNIRYPEVEDGVNFWPNRARIVHDFIDEADADIVCLQEVRPSVKEEFIKNIRQKVVDQYLVKCTKCLCWLVMLSNTMLLRRLPRS